MFRIPEIARSYTGTLLSFAKPRNSHVPHLDLFEKRNSNIKLDILSNPSKSRNSLAPSNYDSILMMNPSNRE